MRLLGESGALAAAPGGRRILKAVRTSPALARRRVGQRPLRPGDIDAELVPPAWHPAIYANRALPPGAVDRDAYVVCVLEQLFKALKRRDVFASPSQRGADPRARLLDGPHWEAVRHDMLAGLSPTAPVEEHLGSLCRGLDAAWRQMAEAGPDAKVEIVVPPDGGRPRLSVDKPAGSGIRPRWLKPSPNTGALTRRCTCSAWSTRSTTPTGGG